MTVWCHHPPPLFYVGTVFSIHISSMCYHPLSLAPHCVQHRHQFYVLSSSVPGTTLCSTYTSVQCVIILCPWHHTVFNIHISSMCYHPLCLAPHCVQHTHQFYVLSSSVPGTKQPPVCNSNHSYIIMCYSNHLDVMCYINHS